MEFDLLLKGGHVIDPANGVDGKADVGIEDKKIARVAPDIPVSAAGKVVDVSGHTVTPGIVDIHTHVYTLLGDPETSDLNRKTAEHAERIAGKRLVCPPCVSGFCLTRWVANGYL